MRRWAPVASMLGWVLGLALVGVTLGALAGLDDTVAPPGSALAGLGALAVAGAFTPHGGRRRWWTLAAGMALAVPGAALVGLGGDLEHPGWLGPAVVAAIVVAAPLVADADRRWAPMGGAPLALAASAAGLYWCVPDTEEARVLLVLTVVAAVVSRVAPLHTLGAPGAMAVTGLYLWIAAFDARGRPAAFVGAAASLGLLVWEPLGARVGERMRGTRAPSLQGRGAAACLAAVQLGLVAYAGRVVGLERSVSAALVLAVPTVLVGVVAGMLAGAPEPAGATPGSQLPVSS